MTNYKNVIRVPRLISPARAWVIRLGCLVAAVAAAFVPVACGDDGGSEAATATGEIDGLVIERVGDYNHVLADLVYPQPAPSGGDHPPSPYSLTCGAYDGEVPEELVVHSLEHGAVWIALGPDSTEDDRAAAEALAEDAKVIVSEVPELPNPVELVAWGVRLPLEEATDERAAAFVETFVDGPDAPEAGSSCEAVGEPPSPPALPSG